MPRLQKILAQAGVASRRHAEELIQAARAYSVGERLHVGDANIIEQSDGRLLWEKQLTSGE